MRITTLSLIAALAAASQCAAFAPAAFVNPSAASKPRSGSLAAPAPLRSMSTDDIPSDYESEDLTPPGHPSVAVDTDEEDAVLREALKSELLVLSSATDRGMFASKDESDIVVDLVTQLEALNPTADPALKCDGEWDLTLTNTQLFRSSPFFLAIRSALGDENKQIADNGFELHNRATSISRIGRVRQMIKDGEMTSEVDLEVGLAPGLPVRIKGTVVTTAGVRTMAPETWELTVRGTRVTRSNVPFLDQYLDDIKVDLPVGDFYATLLGSTPVSSLKTFYVDESIRITRDEDENFYVFSRA
eukprot:CAMPEP_0113568086 /NCGR_PEP_ID=MMETSP0015_2-20120614/23649_1 /TAXON_ID=2838 /ORGANISM="Odontella" /LENGTH=301 /DNA_ID=CAMNT_0000470579 /DNA_START=14 /DNA_END=919 /DNA_ORIENTATION=+ /assembly_acc=CAM_ASM_000160